MMIYLVTWINKKCEGVSKEENQVHKHESLWLKISNKDFNSLKKKRKKIDLQKKDFFYWLWMHLNYVNTRFID